MNDSAGQVRYDITANADDFVDQLKTAGKAINDFGDEVNAVDTLLMLQWNNMANEMQSAMKKAAIEASKPIVDFAKQSISQINSMNKAISSAALSTVQVVSGAAATAITSLVSQGISGADSLAKYNAQVIGLAESTNDANSAMSTAVKFFKNNPFQRFETVEAVKNLMMYDKSIANAADGSARLKKELDMLGVASLSSGTPLAELASKWGEVSSQAKVSKGQFEELALRVPALYDAVGKRMGISASEVSNALDRVGVDTKIVRQAMEDLYGLDTTKLNLPKQSKEFQEYFNSLTGAARQSAEAYLAFNNTLARQTDRVKGRIADMAQAIAGYELTADGGFKAVEGGIYQSVINLEKAFADTMAGSEKTAAKMRSAFGKLGGAIAPFIDKIAEKLPAILNKLFDLIDKLADHIELLLPILAGALTLFGGLASNVPVLGPAIEKITGPIKNLTGTFLKLNPALKILFAILGAGVFKAIKDGKLNGPLKSIFESISKIGKALAPAVSRLMDIAAILGENIIVPTIEALAKVLEVLANVISALPTPVLTAFIGALLSFRAVNEIVGPIRQSISLFKEYSGTVFEFFKNRAKQLTELQKMSSAAKTSGSGVSGEAFEKVGGASESITKAGESLTKGQQMMETMRSGILNMILLAGAIAALGVALNVANQMIPNDMLPLIGKLGLMAVVVSVFGAIGWAIGKINIKQSAILEMVELAGVIAILGVAMFVANRAIPDEIGLLAAKLGIMAGVVAAFGGLAFVGGLAPKQIAVGLLEMVGVAVAIAAVGLAIKSIDRNVPNDIGGITIKLGIISEVVVAMGVVATGIGAVITLGPVALFLASGIASMISLVAGIVIVAQELGVLQKIKLKQNKIINNVNLVMETVRMITDEAAGKSLKDLIESFLEMGIVAAVTNIVNNYVNIAKNLNYLQKLKLNPVAIFFNVSLISSIVSFLAPKPGTGVMGKLKQMINTFLQAGIVQAVSDIVGIYKSIASELSFIQFIILNRKLVIGKVKLISKVVRDISDTSPSGIFGGLSEIITTFLQSKIVENVSLIVGIYVEISKKLQELNSSLDSNKDVRDTIGDKLNYIKDIVTTISTAGGGILKSFQTMVSSDNYKNAVKNVDDVLRVYPEIFNKVKILYDVVEQAGENFDVNKAKENVDHITEVINKVLSIKDGGIFQGISEFFSGGAISVEKVQDIVEIIKNFGLIAKNTNEIPDVGGENYDKIEHIKTVLQKVKDAPRMEDADKVKLINTVNAANDMLFVSASMIHRLNTLEDIGGENYAKIDHIKTAIDKIKNIPGMEEETKVKLINTVNCAADAADAMGRFVNKVNALQDPDNDKLNSVIESINNMIIKLAAISVSAAQQFINVGQEIVSSIINGITSKIPELVASAANIQGSIWNAIEIKMPDEYNQGAALAQNILNGFNSKQSEFSQAGANVQGTIWNAIEPKMKDEYSQGKTLAQNIINGFNSKHKGDDTFYNSGSNAVQGFINGAYSKDVYSVGKKIAERYLNGLKDRGRQGSPWKTTYQSGIWAVEGMIDGIERMSYKLRMSAQSVADTVVDAMTIDNLSDAIGFSNLKNLSMSISGQGEEGTLGGVNSKSNTINIYNTNYAQTDFNQMSRDIMFNISRL